MKDNIMRKILKKLSMNSNSLMNLSLVYPTILIFSDLLKKAAKITMT